MLRVPWGHPKFVRADARKRCRWAGYLLALLATGCTLSKNEAINNGPGSAGSSSENGGAPTTLDLTASGMPCDVAAMFGHYCAGCHGSPPSGGAPDPLLTYADLTKTAVSDPTKTVGQLALVRIQNGTMPPKPATAPSSADIAALNAWLNSGMPQSSCASAVDAGPPVKSPYDTPVQCSSGTTWTSGGEDGSPTMAPGEACISCHSRGEGPRLSIAGTEYPTAHEPDDCNGGNGVSGPPTIVITDANGNSINLLPNAAGNFYTRSSIALPYRAKITAGGNERAMSAAQTSGDCNSCHTESGANGAPGRIMAP